MLLESSTIHLMQMAEPEMFCEPDFAKVANKLKEKPDLTAHVFWALHQEKMRIKILAISARLKEHSGMEWFLKGTSEIAAGSMATKEIPLIRDDLTQISELVFKGQMGLGLFRQLTEEQNKHISFLTDITLIQAENLRRQALAPLQ